MNTNKTVIITGGTKGIGKGAALAFAKKGYNVVISARNEAPETLREIKELGGEATFIKADTSKEQDVVDLVNETVKKYGKLDAFVNNAAITGSFGPLAESSTKNFEEVLQVNLLGTYWGMKYAIQAMLKTGGGSIVNVSSSAGLKGLASMSHYCASKHAMMGLTKATAIEYATQGIRVNVVAPGPIRTEMYESSIAQGVFTEDFFASFNPMKKTGDVADVANAILFLASEETSFMTGAILAVDGGVSAQ